MKKSNNEISAVDYISFSYESASTHDCYRLAEVAHWEGNGHGMSAFDTSG